MGGFVTHPAKGLGIWDSRPKSAGSGLSPLRPSVYTVAFPPDGAKTDIGYYVEAAAVGGQVLRFPATAPTPNQTLLLLPKVSD